MSFDSIILKSNHVGVANGVALETWLSAANVASNRGDGNLLTFVMEMFEKHDKHSLKDVEDLANLEKASS